MTFSVLRTAVIPAIASLVLIGAAAHAETRRVNAITTISTIEADGRFKLEIVGGDTAGATLAGAPEDIARVGIRYRDGELRLREKCRVFCGNDNLDVVVRVVAPQLTSLQLAKGVEATATDLAAQSLTLEVAMGATLRASGRCDTLEADVTMGGALSAKDLECRRVEVDATMGGAAAVRAIEEAKADASMGGAVTVHGNPPRMDSRSAMGGAISLAD